MITPVHTLGNLTDIIKKMIEKIKTFKNMSDEQLAAEIDDDFVYAYESSKTDASMDDYKHYGMGSTSIAVSHARAYLPSAIDSSNAARADFRKAIKPYTEKIESLIKQREEDEKAKLVRQVEDARNTIISVLPEYEKLVAKIIEVDGGKLLPLIFDETISKHQYHYNNAYDDTARAIKSGADILINVDIAKKALHILTLCKNGQMDDVSAFFEAELQKTKNEETKAQTEETTFSRSLYLLMLASTFSEKLSPIVDDVFSQVIPKYIFDSRYQIDTVDEVKFWSSTLRTTEIKQHIARMIEEIKTYTSSEIVTTILKREIPTIDERGHYDMRRIIAESLETSVDVIRYSYQLLSEGKIDELKQYFQDNLKSEHGTPKHISELVLAALLATDLGKQHYPAIKPYFKDYFHNEDNYFNLYRKANRLVRTTEADIAIEKIESQETTIFEDFVSSDPNNQILTVVMESLKGRFYADSFDLPISAYQSYLNVETAQTMLQMFEDGRVEDIISIICKDLQTQDASIVNNDTMLVLFASKHGEKFIELFSHYIDAYLIEKYGEENKRGYHARHEDCYDVIETALRKIDKIKSKLSSSGPSNS